MPFFNQPLSLEIPTSREYPPQFDNVSILMRYARAQDERAYEPKILGAERAGLPLTNDKLGPSFKIKSLGCDAMEQVFELFFLGAELSKRLRPDVCNEDRNLYNAILDRSVIDLLLDLPGTSSSDCKPARVTAVRFKLTPKFP